MNTEQHTIGGIEVEVCWKGIKNLHVGVYPPDGRVRVAAPMTISLDAIRLAVLTRMAWVKRKQAQFQGQERQSPRRLVSGETHFVFGKACRLSLVEWQKRTHKIDREGIDRLRFCVPETATFSNRQRWFSAWQKEELRRVAAPRLEYWACRLSVAPTMWGTRPMRTKWGSCNPDKGTVWLNTELFAKPLLEIDYVILHELAHFISPRHDKNFLDVLDRHLPTWRQIRSDLNSRPLPAWPEDATKRLRPTA